MFPVRQRYHECYNDCIFLDEIEDEDSGFQILDEPPPCMRRQIEVVDLADSESDTFFRSDRNNPFYLLDNALQQTRSTSEIDVINLEERAGSLDLQDFGHIHHHLEDDVVLLSGVHEVANGSAGAFSRDKFDIEPGMTIELIDGSFLRIRSIIRDYESSTRTVLRGHLLQRNRRVDNMLRKQQNELCLIKHIAGPSLEHQCSYSHGQISRSIEQVVCVRDVIYTNESYPRHSWRSQPFMFKSREHVADSGVLVCRWQLTRVCVGTKVILEELSRLRRGDCTHGRPEAELLANFQGLKKVENMNRYHDVDLTDTESTTRRSVTQNVSQATSRHPPFDSRPINHSLTAYLPRAASRLDVSGMIRPGYTYGDMCAGAGGVTMAAKDAGLKLKILLDVCHDACDTLRRNFPRHLVYEGEIHEFCRDVRYNVSHVDLLWISYPCQPHSPAHTRPGKDDEKNYDTMLSFETLIQRLRPRVVIFEQTSGILTHGGRVWLNKLINMVTGEGYSTRIKLLNAADFGNVQSRKRLFLLAAAPGQILPDFPEATHGTSPGLRPVSTLGDILRRMPLHVESHMLAHTVQPRARSFDAYRRTRMSTITTSGIMPHPNGWRSLNLQELALAAGFQPHHRFARLCKTTIRRQIGNAVPYEMAKAVIESAIHAMIKSDEQVAAHIPRVHTID